MNQHPCKAGPNGTPCRNVRLGEAYDISKDCRLCWLFAHDARYNLAWGGDGNVACAPSVPLAASVQAAPKRLLLGDAVKAMLSAIGATEEAAREYLGAPCGCAERQKRLNDLHLMAEQMALKGIEKTRQLFCKLIGALM